MRVLIGCECSGIVREAFSRLNNDAWSCDLKPSELPGNHLQCDIKDVLSDGWDMAIFHPECKYLCWSGERWIHERPVRLGERIKAFKLFTHLLECSIPRICVENSISKYIEWNYRKPDQYIHPYHFGAPYKKTTCLWLKNLTPLIPTNILPIGHRWPYAYMMPGSKDQSARRARTFPEIARAMAEQWSAI